MPRLTDAFALLGISVVLCAGLIAWLGVWRGADGRAVWVKVLAVFCFVLLWIPTGTSGIPVVAYVRGVSGDVSICLVMLAVWRLCQLALNWHAISNREQKGKPTCLSPGLGFVGHAADLAGSVRCLLGSRLASCSCADIDGTAGLELWLVGVR